ncbi:MAG: hypothetical protein AVDCRST_MAG49-4527 [uncultured Thermomicrobiales bacterium]|uniref:Uncharacterized protein n=1 Tax=uncultured Thermomicrobiales bacterium TaxID=1645740 RepID=A0A6J4VI29_9BACT|nr:MAG: hypothetical protein AVDCRST_MAG49-4527 [uncultured Thermomicrobiales bacterium]
MIRGKQRRHGEEASISPRVGLVARGIEDGRGRGGDDALPRRGVGGSTPGRLGVSDRRGAVAP